MKPYDNEDFMKILQSALNAPDPAAYILAEQKIAENSGLSKSDFTMRLQTPFEHLRSKYQQAVIEVAQTNQLNRETKIDEFHYSLGDGRGLSFEEFQAQEEASRQKDLDEVADGAAAFEVLAKIIFGTLEKAETEEDISIHKEHNVPNYSDLEAYFKPSFKGWGQNEKYFSEFVDEVEEMKKRNASAKEFAQVALMCYEGGRMNDRKPSTFKQWYEIFCNAVGCEYRPAYPPNKLKDIPLSLKKLFVYLE